MPLQTQVKLLQFLEEGRFRRVGSTRDQSADVRVIAATNRNLADDVSEGRFRTDLFYRLNVVSLHVPALRERPEDIPELIDYFRNIYRKRFNRPALDLTAEARLRMESYPWPGNVRELRNCLERAAALSSDDMIEATLILPMLSQAQPPCRHAAGARKWPRSGDRPGSPRQLTATCARPLARRPPRPRGSRRQPRTDCGHPRHLNAHALP